MKKILRLLLLGVAVGCCLFALASCGGGQEPEETECAHDWGEGTLLTAATCAKEGAMFYKCSICGAQKTEVIPKSDQHRFSSETYYAKEPTARSDGELCRLCLLCGAEERTPADYASYKKKYDAAVAGVNGFMLTDFGSTQHSALSTTKYAAPTASPTAGQHPRLLFNAADMETLRAAWHDPAFYSLVKLTVMAGNSNENGVRPAAPSGGNNYKDGGQAVLNTAVRKAFLYQLTGVKLYGYEAILIAKNLLKTLDIQGGYGDPTRAYGEVMFYMGLVYDWCYPLLSAADKEQFMRGVQHYLCEGKMEMGFPPSGQDAVSGHGCERQLLRDYLSFAIAIYDDDPTWYQFIGGRFFEEYVPVRNEYYKSGYSPQGISVYLSLRFCSDLWSAWIMKSATGKNPYDEATMKQVMRSVYTRIVDGGSTFFDEGDDEARTHIENLYQFALPAQISAYLFQDTTVAAWAKYSGYSYTPDLFQFLLHSQTPAPAEDRYADLEPILYNGGFISQIVAHSGWTKDDVTVMMKIGERTTSNHDHSDAGSFQIYYKGLLAGDSGFYDSYGTAHHQEYHQQTIAHNSIVFYRKTSGTAFTTLQQKHPGEPHSLSNWKTDAYKLAETTGYTYGYADAEKKNPTYAYVAGDLAPAYGETASEVTRRMLTVFNTGREDIKAYFFVFDHVSGKQKATDETVFLLHTLTQPEKSGKTVKIVSGNGRLVLQNLFGGDRIDLVGGEGKNYYLNGAQSQTKTDPETGKPYDDGYWGRVEIAPATGNRTDTMLNLMYVSDDTATTVIPANKIETDAAVGGVIGNTAAAFLLDKTPRTDAFTFTANGSGTLNYYVSGVAAGNWTVTVGGNTQTVKSDGGLLVFSAPAGSVTLTKQ